MKNQKTIIIVMGVLLAIAMIFIVATQIRAYNIEKAAEEQVMMNQAAQEGYTTAIRELMQQASTCNPVPVFADNVTLNLVAVECLQQQQGVQTQQMPTATVN